MATTRRVCLWDVQGLARIMQNGGALGPACLGWWRRAAGGDQHLPASSATGISLPPEAADSRESRRSISQYLLLDDIQGWPSPRRTRTREVPSPAPHRRASPTLDENVDGVPIRERARVMQNSSERNVRNLGHAGFTFVGMPVCRQCDGTNARLILVGHTNAAAASSISKAPKHLGVTFNESLKT